MMFCYACKKNMDYFIADAGQQFLNTNWYTTVNDTLPVMVLKQSLLLPLFTDNFTIPNNSGPLKLLFTSGLQCSILPSSLNAGGQAVTGKIDVQTILLKKKGDLIRMGRPTISNDKVLVSGGSLYIALTQNENPISIVSGTIGIHYTENNPSFAMKLFNGDTTNTQQFNWIPNVADSNNVVADSTGYKILTQKLNWLNCGYYYDSVAPKTMVAASLPAYFTNATTIAFLAFNDVRSVVGMYGTAATKQFISGSVPVGKPATVIILSKQGNNYYLGQQTVTTASPAAGLTVQFVAITPIKTTLDNIKQYLDAL